MAETDTETLPNGTGALSNEEEEERLRQRPADIDAVSICCEHSDVDLVRIL